MFVTPRLRCKRRTPSHACGRGPGGARSWPMSFRVAYVALPAPILSPARACCPHALPECSLVSKCPTHLLGTLTSLHSTTFFLSALTRLESWFRFTHTPKSEAGGWNAGPALSPPPSSEGPGRRKLFAFCSCVCICLCQTEVTFLGRSAGWAWS